ncbi:PAS domain S-box-containing protein [Thermoflavifilum aggregans]|uniref:histidine kinase n=1 Tax=Thermoflavifilum aggregans TaxID=454188 RepID=A0A2M9CU24_9BACT|nr:PAS domain S-box protein [Thermoflavifilum aggregans]PJJ75383.1 PAS domain S-box-containing protein [Thermoflavifilum aggregans]
MKLTPFLIAFLYLLIGVCWIVFSDSMLVTLAHRTGWAFAEHLQTVKGIGYVVVTAALLYVFIRKLHKQLSHAEEDYKRLFLENPQVLYVFDVQTFRFLEVNKATETQYGYTRDEFLRMTLLDIRPPEERNRFLALNHSIADKTIHFWGRWKHQRKDGQILIVEIYTHPVNFQGRDARLTYVRDVTAMVHAQEELADLENKLQAIINSTDDAIWAIDTHYRLVVFNQAFANIMQLKTGKTIQAGQTLWIPDYANIEQANRWMDAYSKAMAGEKVEFEETDVLQDGEKPRYAHVSMHPILNDQQKVIGVACILHDITSMKEQELRLKEALERYDLVTKATNDAIWDWDIPNNRVVFNEQFWQMFGYEPTEQGGQLWEENLHPDDKQRVLRGIQQALDEKQTIWADEYRLRCGDGKYKYVLDRAYILYDEHQRPVRMIGATQDIQLKKEYEQAILRQNEQLREIAYVSSHEVRGPASALMGLFTLLEEYLTAQKDLDYQELMPLIQQSLEQLDSVIHKIVDKTSRLMQ